MAAYALMRNGCEGDVLYATSSLYHVLTLQAEGFRSFLDESCDCCDVEEIDVDLTTAATDLGPETSTVLRRNPDITYAVAAIDFLLPFMQSGVDAVNPELPVMGSDGTSAAMEMLRSGELDADMAFPPNEFVGWLGIDALGRILLEEPVDQRTFVSQLVDDTNAGTSVDEVFPAWIGYKDDYRAAWGL
jgi:ribose transport system substrate-binding protein